jgi:hypothetical protein
MRDRFTASGKFNHGSVRSSSPANKVKPAEARIRGKNGKNILRLCLVSLKI